jgi:hypothetical protein
MRPEVVGQSFDNEVGHVWAHLQGEPNFTFKSMISLKKLEFIDPSSRIQDFAHHSIVAYHFPSTSVKITLNQEKWSIHT